ncbi:MAG: type II secretion system F family protein [Planctomycetota bacterium]|nr:MAG: type II secretion system F family protein [Planctomycetota bacterium]
MPDYAYEAKDAEGKVVRGSINASDENSAVSTLRRQNLTVTSLKVQTGKSKPKKTLWEILNSGIGSGPPKPRIKSQDMVVFTRQLATMLSAGIPLLECLEILQEQAQDPGFKLILEEVVSDVRSGSDLSEALKKHPKIFQRIYVNMVKAGEASGQLEEILDRLAGYQEAAEKLRSEIKSAMMYPTVSLCLVFGITIFLMMVIVPKFDTMFKRMNVPLPGFTKALMFVSTQLRNHWALWFGSFFGSLIAVFAYFKTSQGQRVKDILVINLPVFGDLFRKVAISRFSRTFSTLIQSGVPILGALEIVASTAGNKLIEEAVLEASESVRQGETLAKPLSRSKIFPPMVTRMISIGEKSGALENLLEKISEFYDQQVEATVKTLTSLIEPIMIAIMGVTVGGIVLAIFIPILKMQKAVQKK